MAFKCCMCKEMYDGSPVMTNGAGDFCTGCQKVRIQKAKIGYVKYMENKKKEATSSSLLQNKKVCIWCGCCLDTVNHGISSGSASICRKCEKNRDWLRSCIYNSDHVYKYVCRTEKDATMVRKNKEITMQEQKVVDDITKMLKMLPASQLKGLANTLSRCSSE